LNKHWNSGENAKVLSTGIPCEVMILATWHEEHRLLELGSSQVAHRGPVSGLQAEMVRKLLPALLPLAYGEGVDVRP
jgi:hypothetical protein